MPSRYHPLYDGIWSHPKLAGAAFEEKGFFVFCFANSRVRPSGIYLMTDEQAAADTTLPIRRVREYMIHLDERRLIVRDAPWMFVRGYLARQPKGANLLSGVESDVSECSSRRVLRAFGLKYPKLNRWSADRLSTIDRPLQVVTEQSSTEQSITSPPSAPASESNGATGFEEFYQLYPRKKAPGAARRAWSTAMSKAAPADILAALTRQLEDFSRRPSDRVPYPATWLNGEQWRNEPDESSKDDDPDDPYKDWPRLYDCPQCGQAHETRACPNA